MATIEFVFAPKIRGDITTVRWIGLANGDVGSALDFSEYFDRSIQVVGTFGAAGSMVFEGSNDGGTVWATMTDYTGNPLTFSSAGIKQISELPERVRPRVTTGDGTTNLSVHIFMRGRRG